LDIFINDAESLVHAQKKSAVESIEEFESYTAEEIEKDCNDMKAITGAYKKDNPNDPDFVKLAEKKLSQWSEDNKPNINVQAVRRLPLDDRLKVLHGFARASIPKSEDLLPFPSQEMLLSPSFPADKNRPVTPSNYVKLEIGKQIGEGGYGEVYEARVKSKHSDAKYPYAAKKLVNPSKAGISEFQNEEEVLRLFGEFAKRFPKAWALYPQEYGIRAIRDDSNSDQIFNYLLTQLIHGTTLHDFLVLVTDQVNRSELSLSDGYVAAWASTTAKLFALRRLASYRRPHGDGNSSNFMWEKYTASLRGLDPSRSKQRNIDPNVEYDKLPSSNIFLNVYPEDLARVADDLSLFYRLMFPSSPIPDMDAIWKDIGFKGLLETRQSIRINTLTSRILREWHVHLEKEQIEQLAITTDASIDALRSEIEKKLPSVDLTVSNLSVEDQEKKLAELDERQNLYRQRVSSLEGQFAQKFESMIESAFTRLARSTYRSDPTSSDIRDFDYFVDMPNDWERAFNVVKQVYALSTLKTHKTNENISVHNRLIREAVRSTNANEQEIEQIISNEIELLKTHPDYAMFDINVFRHAMRGVIDRTLALRERFFLTFLSLNPLFDGDRSYSNRQQYNAASLIKAAISRPVIGNRYLLVTARNLLGHFALDTIPVLGKDGFVYEDEGGRIIKTVQHPAYGFNLRVAIELLVHVHALATNLVNEISERPELKNNTEALLRCIGIDGHFRHHSDTTYVFWEEVAIQGGYATRKAAPEMSITELEKRENRLWKSNSERFKNGAEFQAEGPSYLSEIGLPALQHGRWNNLTIYLDAIDLSSLDRDLAVVTNEKDRAALIENEKQLLTEWNDTTAKYNKVAHEANQALAGFPMNPEVSPLSALTQESLMAERAHRKDLLKELKALYREMVTQTICNGRADACSCTK